MEPKLRLAGTVLSTRDTNSLASFYERLLGWNRLVDEPGWVIIGGDTGAALSFHADEHYLPPIWPSVPGEQLMMLHLDIATDDLDDLDGAVAHAAECGARLADHQPQDDVRVMIDPDGHPFCLFPSPNM